MIACNNSGVWNEEGAFLDFTIAPAYYQTNWFRALCAAVALALLWALYRLRIRQLQQREWKFREAIETIPAMAFMAQPDGSRTFVNRRWVEYHGVECRSSSRLRAGRLRFIRMTLIEFSRNGGSQWSVRRAVGV